MSVLAHERTYAVETISIGGFVVGFCTCEFVCSHTIW